MKFIVTVRVDPHPGHDPNNKQRGACAFSNNCSDVTGAHHSFLESAPSESMLRHRYRGKPWRITRVEEVFTNDPLEGFS